MRKIALALALLSAFGATSAMAAAATTPATTPPAKPAMTAPAPLTATGPITAIDLKAHTITINKVVYHFSHKANLTKLKVGENVTVTYKIVGKVDWVSKIAVAKA